MAEKREHQGEHAVITGASSGIGFELAKQFAENGFDLTVVAENDEIHSAAEEFRKFGTQVDALRMDLTKRKNVEALSQKLRKRPIDVLALNAGVGVGGASFDKTELEDEFNLLRLNIFCPVHLTKYVLKDMIDRGSGRILFTSSVASWSRH